MASSSSPSTSSTTTTPWTPDEFRRKSCSWTLEGDAKLLEFMQNIAASLESHATKTTESIHRLSLDVDRTDVALCNVTNKLSALQHSQFVENRVYEDDEIIANVAEVPVSDEADNKSKYDPIETLSKLLDNSMSVLERCYEKVSIDMEDSDEEDEPTRSIIYRPKDPYDDRPLPHIIGSKEWMEKWHVGLCDSDDDFSGEEKEDEFSESSDSASMSASLPSNAPTISESELSAWGLQENSLPTHIKRRPGSYGSSDEDLSNTTKQLFDDGRHGANNGITTIPRQAALPTEIPSSSQYYVHKPKPRERGLFDESTDESTDSELYNVNGKSERTVPLPVPVMRRDNRISNIISDEPPPDLDVVDRHDRPSVDLFCESEEEVPLDKPEPSSSTAKREEPISTNIRKKTVNLFDDDDFDSFMKELNTKTIQKVVKPVKNLFEESSDEEADVVKKDAPDTHQSKVHITEKTISKRLSPQESIKSKENPQMQRIDAELAPNIESTVERSNKSLKKKESTIVTKIQENVSNPTNTRNIFDDEEEKDDFSNILRPPVASKRTLITNLFDDEPLDDDFDSLFNSTKPTDPGQSDKNVKTVSTTTITKKLFDDSDDDHDIIATPKDTMKSVAEEQTTERLRAGEEENSLFKTDKKETKSKTFKLFADASDEDSADLFGENVSKEQIKNNYGVPKETPLTHSLVAANNTPPDRGIEDGALLNIPREVEKEADSNENKTVTDNSANPSSTSGSSITNVPKQKLSNIFTDDIFDENELFLGKETLSTHRDPIKNQLNQEKDSQSSTTYSEQTPSISTSAEDSVSDRDGMKNTLTDTSNISATKPTVTDKKDKIFSTNLFSDVPPEDDDDIFPTKRVDSNNDIFGSKRDFEATYSNDLENTCTVDEPAEGSINAFNYNSVGLFHDSPPDDDFNATPQYGKKLHSIFYDDFSETIIPSQMDARPKSLSSYIFEEPPPDFQEPPPITESPSTSTLKEKSLPNIFEQPPTDHFEQASSLLETTDPKSRRQETEEHNPPKLESEGKIASIIDRMQHQTDIEEDQESAVKVTSQPKKINSNLKINVTALLPGAKRPPFKPVEKNGNSDRQISKELSRNEDDEIVSSAPRTIQTESDTDKLQSLNKSRAKIQVKRRPSTRKARQENYRRSTIENDTSVLTQENMQSTEAAANYTNASKQTPSGSTNEQNRSHQLSTSASTLFNTQPPPIPYVPNEPQFKPSTVFFEDEPPGDFFKAPSTRKESEKPPPTTSLFFEDDSDNNDFLAATTKKFSSTIHSKGKSEPVKLIKEPKLEVQKNLSASLFDDESDDTDLFAKSLQKAEKQKIDVGKEAAVSKQSHSALVAKKGSKSKVSNASKSLFGSDDDGDDLFGGGVSVSKSNIANAEKSSSTKQKLSSGRLFDDKDEEDDDLFGGAKQKYVPQPSTRRSDSKTKAKITQSLQSKPDSKNFNDPLADLFKN